MEEGKGIPSEKKPNLILRSFIWLTIIAFFVHFVLITLYCFRDDMPTRVNAYTDRYAIPAFHQNWKLFAPDLPRYNVELEYRYAKQAGWSEWRDASHSFGYSSASRMETIEQGFNTSLGWQVLNNFYSRDGRKQFDRIMQSTDYARSLFYVLKMHQIHVEKELPDSVQLRLNFRFTPPPDKAYTFQTSTLEFPVFTPQP